MSKTVGAAGGGSVGSSAAVEERRRTSILPDALQSLNGIVNVRVEVQSKLFDIALHAQHNLQSSEQWAWQHTRYHCGLQVQ